MIKSISATGRYMQVSGGSASTYVNNYTGAVGVGNLRYNTSNQNLEVYDGTSWITLNMSHATVGLNGDAESLIDWARQKRDEELKFKELLDQHPGVRDLKEKLDIMVALVTEQIKQGE